MIEIVIGRDGTTSQLKLAVGQQSKSFGAQGSVPQTVSRQHCSLTVNDNGTYTLKNLKLQNVTFVNGQQIDTKTISDSDTIELGPDKYLVSWSVLKTVLPSPPVIVDIRPLKDVWDNYQQNDIKIRDRQKINGLWASVPLGFSMLGGLIAGIAPEVRNYAIILSVIAFVTWLYGLYRRSQDNSTVEQKENQTDFEMKWVCPNPKCKRPLTGFRSYTILSQADCCPYCKAKFKRYIG